MRNARWLAAVVFAWLLCTETVLSDILHLKDGRKLEGEIVEETDDYVVIQFGKLGSGKFSWDEIDRIERAKTPRQEYEDRRGKLREGDVAATIELAAWCQQKGLHSEAMDLYRAVLKHDKNNVEAHKALGHVLHQGEWVSRAEKLRMEREAEAEEKRRQGYELYKGEWVKKEDIEKIEQGYVLHEGRWISAEEKKKAELEAEMKAKGMVFYEGAWLAEGEVENIKKGLFKIGEGKWVAKDEADEYHSTWDNAWKITSPSGKVVVRTNCSYDDGNRLATQADQALLALEEMFGTKVEAPGEPLVLYILRNLSQYRVYGEQLGTEHSSGTGCFVAEQPEDIIDFENAPPGWDQPRGITYYLDSQPVYTDMWVNHLMAHLFLRRTLSAEPPSWFVESIASYLEFCLNERLKSWSRGLVQEMARQNRWVSVTSMLGLFDVGPDQNQAGRYFKEAAHLIDFMLHGPSAEYREALAKFIDLVKKGKGTTDAFKALVNVDKLEADFKAFLQS